MLSLSQLVRNTPKLKVAALLPGVFATVVIEELAGLRWLCVPKFRFCNIDGEGRQGQVVR
jgi:hypothetical protein